MSSGFLRRIETDFLEMAQEIPVIGLLGPRQVGKTTFVRSIANQLNKPSVYLDLELPSDVFKLEQTERYLSEHQDKVVILDEIQRLPEIFPVLRSLVDIKREPGRFIILGSASPALLKQSSESLAGRISFFNLEPLHYQEIKGEISIDQHWFRGGFPDILLASSDKLSARKMDAFIRTYCERDLPSLGLPSLPEQTRKLLQMLTSVHGNLLNISSLSRSFGMSSPTVQSYIEFLEQAFILRLLRPFHTNVSKRLVKSPKLYFRDAGMLHSLSAMRNREELLGNLLIGASWEGYVVQQIIANLPYNVDPYFYRTQDGAEIDLVLVKGNKPYLLIEVKYSSTPTLTRGNYLVQKDLGNIPMKVVVPGTGAEEILLAGNISVCSLPLVFKYL